MLRRPALPSRLTERASELTARASGLPADVKRQLQELAGNVAAARARLAEIGGSLPPDAKRELATSAKRLAFAARSPTRFAAALSVELERLIDVLVPLAAATPLPLTAPARARATVAVAAGAAAATAEAEGLLAIFSAGAAAAPGAPVVAAALLTAWAVELWGTVSVRIHQIEAAGRVVDGELLRAEVTEALVGSRRSASPARRVGRRIARRIAARLVRRWTAGLAPGVGIAYDAFDAQRTVRDVTRLPVDGHPRRPPGLPSGS
jgi:hypothetical protein